MKRIATPEKYGPGERTVKFKQDGVKFRSDNQSGRGRSQYQGGYRAGARGGQGRGGGYENGGGSRNNDYDSYKGTNSPGQGSQGNNRKLDRSQYRGDNQSGQQQEVAFRGNGNQSGGRNNHSYDYKEGDRRDSYRSHQQQQYRANNKGGDARNDYMNRQLHNDMRYNNSTNSPIATHSNNGTYSVHDGLRGKFGSPMDQPLMLKIGQDGYPGWLFGDMRIPDPPRISQQELVNLQQSKIDRKLKDAMNFSMGAMGRTVHVPISANFAVLDDNLIDNNVYYYEPPCLSILLSDLLDKFTLYYLTNESKFYAVDLLGAYFELSERRDDIYESRISE